LGFHEGELSILLTDDDHISDLNRRYLGKEGPTNVLAFPMRGEASPEPHTGILGDVVVSVDTALEESRKSGEPLNRTVHRLLVHGILHLLGYDHDRSPQEGRRMRRKEDRLLGLMEGE